MRGSAWVDHLSLASRGTIDKESVVSSERAVDEESRGPHNEATQGPEETEKGTGSRGPQGEATQDHARVSAEGESHSNVASETSLAATVAVKCEDNAEGDNLAIGTSQVIGKSEGQEEVAVKCEETDHECSKGEKRKHTDEETDDETAKKVKSECKDETAEELEEHVEAKGTECLKEEAAPQRRAPNPMDMAVVLQGFPEEKITKAQANVLEAKLVARLKKSTGEEPVQFLATAFEDGAVIFTCANEWTKKWLTETVSELEAWAKLEAGPADVVLYGAKLILWVSRIMKKRETHQILELLEKQNKGISTKDWKIIERKDLPKQASLIMWIDENSYKVLKEYKFRLHLGLGQATFKPGPVAKSQSDAGPSGLPGRRYVPQHSTRARYRKFVYPKPPQLMQLRVRMPSTHGPRGIGYRTSNQSYGRRFIAPRSSQHYGHRYMSR